MQIKLSNCEFSIDKETWVKLSNKKWWYDKSTGYIFTRINRKKVYLHRAILNAGTGDIVDHIDRNKLNNSIRNLRKVSKSLNNHNRDYTENHGVYFDKYGNRWRACISLKRKTLKLGSFHIKETAIIAYNRKAVEIYGNSARLN